MVVIDTDSLILHCCTNIFMCNFESRPAHGVPYLQECKVTSVQTKDGEITLDKSNIIFISVWLVTEVTLINC